VLQIFSNDPYRWVLRHDGRCTPTHLAKNSVAGITRTSEALTLMRRMADCGYGHCDERVSGNHRRVIWFVAKRAVTE
jgi:hypothetical protein